MEKQNSKLSGLIKSIGPGILFAGAAIGGSHLIQSTRAGADYYFDLLLIVLLVNLFKYPFFEYGHRYFLATGNNILDGYHKLGTWTLSIFAILSSITGVINYIALSAVTAGLLKNVIGLDINIIFLTLLTMISSVVILLLGKYSLLDKTVKVIIVVLSISTITAFILAAANAPSVAEYPKAEIWTTAGIAFLIALMGWMPAPVELSVWTSQWAVERRNQTKHIPTRSEGMADFYLGYVGTAIMAVFFVGLGAFVMFGSGVAFESRGDLFAGQLVSLYTKTLGIWSTPIIETAAFLTIFSSLITVIDGYPRSIAGAFTLISKKFKDEKKNNIFITISMGVVAALVFLIIPKTMKELIDMATIISFLAAPLFAYINLKTVTFPSFPEDFKPKRWLRILSYLGIIFLSVFSLIYLYSLIVGF